ncbi:MAG: Glycerol-3-phosphate dehydrogenase [NAD(P)+] [Hyphomicrobiaceae bacterium hypho_1]
MIGRNFQRVGIVGGGAWGTALAQIIAVSGLEVTIWSHEKKTAHNINKYHINHTFLTDVTLNKNISATICLQQVADNDLLLIASPAQHLRRVAAEIQPYIKTSTPVLLCAKGIEKSSGKLLTKVLGEELPGLTHGVLSGPSFASEVARGLPAALTVACHDESLSRRVATTFGSKVIRIYWTDDIVGVQSGGAFKNVIAIAAGIVDGKQLGTNASAAIITRGFAEMLRFAQTLGARAETLNGLSGLGDLLLTCGSPQSRNMSLGRALGQGHSIAEIVSTRKTVTEGIHTVEPILRIARSKKINLPISDAINSIINCEMTVDKAIDSLLSRPFRPEN